MVSDRSRNKTKKKNTPSSVESQPFNANHLLILQADPLY